MRTKKVKLSDLTYDPANTRKHEAKNLDTIKASLNKFGQQKPIVVNKNNVVVAGNGTLEAAIALGWEEITVVVTELNGVDATAYAIADNRTADNRTAELAEWDDESLARTLEALRLDDSIDESVTGFTDDEIADLLNDLEHDGSTEEDDIPGPPEQAITKRGDLWLLGKHRLLCGDSTSSDDVDRLMDGKLVDLVFTSPPYNVDKKYNSHDDAMGVDEYRRFMADVLNNCKRIMNCGVMIAWNVGVSPKTRPHHHAIWLEESGFTMFRHIVWKKTGCQIPLWQNTKKDPSARHYMPNYNHELILLFTNGTVEYGNPTTMSDDISMDVWDISQFSAGGHNHPAAFPITLATMVIQALTSENEKVYEPFTGSGSALVACEPINRICFGMEIDPRYCDVVCERWSNMTGEQPILEESGKTFDEMKEERHANRSV